MNKQPSSPDPDTFGALLASAGEFAWAWLRQTALLYVSPRIDFSRFPTKRALSNILNGFVAVLFFLSMRQQGGDVVSSLVIALAMGVMASFLMRANDNVRYSGAFQSILFLGVLVNVVMTAAGASNVAVDIESAWVMITVLRVSLAALPKR